MSVFDKNDLTNQFTQAIKSPQSELNTLQEWLYHQIPAIALLDIQLEQADLQAVRLRANFTKNRNHHNTMFGGSIALIATACGWISAFVQSNYNVHIVIKRSEIDYILPVTSDLVALCQPVSVEEIKKCQKMLQRFDKGVLIIECLLLSNNQLSAHWRGEFVIYSEKD